MVKELIDHLKLNYKAGDVIAYAIWSYDDVLSRATERGIKLTLEQAEAILEKMHDRHDATIGLNWDTVDAATDAILEK